MLFRMLTVYLLIFLSHKGHLYQMAHAQPSSISPFMMSFQPGDRLPVVEWCMWWDQATGRWRRDGLADDIRKHSAADLCLPVGGS